MTRHAATDVTAEGQRPHDQQTVTSPGTRGQEPLVIRWDRLVVHSSRPGDPTLVCCVTEHDGAPVALLLDDELREALGLLLIEPEPADG